MVGCFSNVLVLHVHVVCFFLVFFFCNAVVLSIFCVLGF